MLESTQQLTKGYLDYYVSDLGWIIYFVKFAEHEFADLAYKDTFCQPYKKYKSISY